MKLVGKFQKLYYTGEIGKWQPTGHLAHDQVLLQSFIFYTHLFALIQGSSHTRAGSSWI